MFILITITRFLVAGVIPFLCIFSQTLLQYNAMFALGGMVGIVCTYFFDSLLVTSSINLSFDFVQVNHTLADWETLEEWEVSLLDQQLTVSDHI